ncbi:MAG: V-type ATP synthase subunit D [Candidatus Hermodarchaeota archaeon]
MISFREIKPTKTNLINLQKRLSFAVKGQNFLEFRREQLIFQIKKLWKDYNIQRKELVTLFKETLNLLIHTYEEMGKNGLYLISKLSRIQYKPTIQIQTVKKMGIVVSQVYYELFQEEKLPAYTFENTSHYLDDLFLKLKDFFYKIIEFSEIEDLLLKVAINFKKINRRINGLKNIIIPKLKYNIKQIKEILEEIERENYVRLKKTKDLIIKQEEFI